LWPRVPVCMTRTRLLSFNAAAGAALAAVLLTLGPASAAAASTAKAPVALKTPQVPAHLRVTSQVTTGSASAVLRPAGRLSASDAAGPVSLTDVAIANGTLVATGSQLDPSTGTLTAAQRLYVYSKPASGWQAAQNPTTYQPSDGDVASGYAIGDGFVATEQCTAGEGCGSAAYDIAILTRQAGSEQLSGAAQLATGQESIVTDGPEGVMAAGGNTVLTGTSRGPLHVFTEPTGGWTGTVQPAAELQTSDGAQLFKASLSGDVIAALGRIGATGPVAVYVFTEPVDGWSGAVTQTAKIPIAGAFQLGLSGSTMAVLGGGQSLPGRGSGQQLPEFPLYVLHRPGVGWRTSAPPAPRAFIDGAFEPEDLGSSLGAPSIAGGSVVIADTGGYGAEKDCPCNSAIWAIGNLAGHAPALLRTPVLQSAKVSQTFDQTVAVDGTTVAIGAADGIHLYTRSTPQPARIAAATLRDLNSTWPRLSLSLASSTRGASIASVRLVPPTRLRVSGRTAVRRRGITASGSGGVKANQGTSFDTVFLHQPRRATTVAVGSGALLESQSLRAALTRIARHGGQRTLTFDIRVGDTAGRSSQSRVTFTIKH
jgi:hypothetical protein